MKKLSMTGKRIVALFMTLTLTLGMYTVAFAGPGGPPPSYEVTSTTQQEVTYDGTAKPFNVTWKNGNAPRSYTVWYDYDGRDWWDDWRTTVLNNNGQVQKT